MPMWAWPRLALAPRFAGAAGARLRDLIGVDDRTYLSAFRRANVSDLDREAFARGRGHVVVLGRAVARWAGAARLRYFEAERVGTRVLLLIPHPSGRCRVYNDPEMRRRAGEAVRRLAGL